jgi:hypothetical protein
VRITPDSNIGWVVQNGSGWNYHKTAVALNAMLIEFPDDLPPVPKGYAVLVAPISDKPLGLRCALVKGLDNNQDNQEYDAWAAETFGCEVQKIGSCKCEYQQDDDSQYFMKIMAEQISKLRRKMPVFAAHYAENKA